MHIEVRNQPCAAYFSVSPSKPAAEIFNYFFLSLALLTQAMTVD